MIDSILFTVARIATFADQQSLTTATGFFFQRNDSAGNQQLFLVTNRHVMIDQPTGHHPNRLEIELHTNSENVAESVWYSIPLYRNGQSLWRQGKDTAGEIDIAVIEIDRSALPESAMFQAFTPANLPDPHDNIEIGSLLLVVGYPLGFHDSLHHLPVARHAVLASSYGMRFKGEGYFLTDARTHRGTSGSPVVMKNSQLGELPWSLLGVHSARLDVGARDMQLDEALGLNCAWYADILMTLTA